MDKVKKLKREIEDWKALYKEAKYTEKMLISFICNVEKVSSV